MVEKQLYRYNEDINLQREMENIYQELRKASGGGGGGAVDSVFGRSGTVVANPGDYTWAQINKASSSISDIAYRDHSRLTGLSDDDHTQYSLASGVRAFTGPVTGVTPTADLHLATKGYVDDNAGSSAAPVAETPSGAINGANVTFTLAETPSGTAGVLVLLDGIMQYNGSDYSVTGDTITFTTAPATGSSIFSYYNISSADAALGDEEARINLNLSYNIAKDTAYKEFTFASGKLTGIDIWETSSKTTKLFTKTLSFTGDVLNTVTTVDELNSKTLTKTFTYNGSDIDTISEVIT